MLSIPHMIVVFIVVLVVFGPQKLPELARSFGKLMAEFRKASTDFKSAFEEEMRDLERQARIADLKKQAAEAVAAAEAITNGTATPAATLASPAGTASEPALLPEERVTEAPVISPAADSVPRLDATIHENGVPPAETQAELFEEQPVPTPPNRTSEAKPADPNPSHDQQQPA